MSLARDLRVECAGAGTISVHHLRGSEAVAPVVAACDPDRERAPRRADALHTACACTNVDAMLDSCRLDAIENAASLDARRPRVRAAGVSA